MSDSLSKIIHLKKNWMQELLTLQAEKFSVPQLCLLFHSKSIYVLQLWQKYLKYFYWSTLQQLPVLHLLVCTRTQHWAQLTSRLVPSSPTWGLDSCPSPLSFVLLVWVLKHISGMRGLDHWRPSGRFTNVTQELPLLDSDLRVGWRMFIIFIITNIPCMKFLRIQSSVKMWLLSSHKWNITVNAN